MTEIRQGNRNPRNLYRTPDHEVDDEPIPAPDEMPQCKPCVRARAEREAGRD